MPNVLMYKTSSGFMPADDVQREVFEDARVPNGELVNITFTANRKYKFLQKYHVMIRATFDMQDTYKILAQWRAVVTVGSGHCDFVPGKNGEIVAIPKSISYNSLPDEAEFQKIYEDALTFICENYVDDTPGRIETILRFM